MPISKRRFRSNLHFIRQIHQAQQVADGGTGAAHGFGAD